MGGFYAEFLTPLVGRSHTPTGEPLATAALAGVTAQRLRYLDLLFIEPWSVTLGEDWGAPTPTPLRIPNPAVFIAQKLLIHDDREPRKQSQDLLYIHDTIELFAEAWDDLAALWRGRIGPRVELRWVDRLRSARSDLFGAVDDRLRDAARIPPYRTLDPWRRWAMCLGALEGLLG